MLEARSLTKYYEHTAAVRGVSFTIRPGEILGYIPFLELPRIFER